MSHSQRRGPRYHNAQQRPNPPTRRFDNTYVEVWHPNCHNPPITTTSLKRSGDGRAHHVRLSWSETMPEVNERSYYAQRASNAAKLAGLAEDPKIAAIHRAMAASYRELAEMTPATRKLRWVD